jgi:dihydrofolate reductase/thymidylate synthase
MKSFSVILASTRRGGIGLSGRLPWPKLTHDMNHFVNITSKKLPTEKQNAVIMGRKTWDSIDKYKPFKNRINYIITRDADKFLYGNKQFTNIIHPCKSLPDAISLASMNSSVNKLFVIGGGQIYAQALSLPHCKEIYHTEILNDFPADVHVPEIDKNIFKLENIGNVINENEISYQFLKYIRNSNNTEISSYSDFLVRSGFDKRILMSRNPEEMRYLSFGDYIMNHGTVKGDRTGVGTHAVFGEIFRYNLENNTWPILTTKKVFVKGITKELLWLISGSTDGNVLLKDGVKIWYGNGTRQFLDKNNLFHYKEHHLGPVYGHQWRHSGAEYKGADVDYKGKGVDQLADVIKQLKENPDSRRHIICAWNPPQLKQMALPPCHVLIQFYVSNGYLSCMMFQRSSDYAIGNCYNVASYSLLTHMIAHITGLKAKEFIHVIGDAHVYKTHIDGLREQITREPYEFPKVNFKRKITNIDDFKFDDIELVGYKSHPAIKFEMAV